MYIGSRSIKLLYIILFNQRALHLGPCPRVSHPLTRVGDDVDS